jgi:phenylacetate-CoA ligase
MSEEKIHQMTILEVKMISLPDYSSLGTSNKRSENADDHIQLEQLMRSRWDSVRDFCLESPEAIRDWQFMRIKELVRHAYDTVPLYREKYGKEGFEPGDLKCWGDFDKLPILYKDELIDGFPERILSSGHDMEFTTRSSGSSGRFVTLAVSRGAIYEDTIQGARQMVFQSGGSFQPSDCTLFIYTSPWWVSSINGKYPTEFLPSTTPVEEAKRIIEEIRPKALSLYPTYLLKLHENAAKLKESGVELVIVHSEQSTKAMREELSRSFGVPVLDEFSSEELTRIALECPQRRYHLEEDACFIEIVDPSSKQPIAYGKRGLVIGTNLLNEATPIIRYHQGDIASLVGNAECGCGSNFRVMDSPDGRVMDSIVTLEGNIIPASCFMDIAYNWYLELDVPVHGLKYQIIQDQDKSIDIYVVPGQYGISPSQQKRINKSLYQLVPANMHVSTHVVDKPVEDTGIKYRPVISHAKR